MLVAEEIKNRWQQRKMRKTWNEKDSSKEIIEEFSNRETSPVLKEEQYVTDKQGASHAGTYCSSTYCSSRSTTGSGSDSMEFLPTNCI